MKRKIIFLLTLVALTGLVVMQGCKKEKGPANVEHFSFTAPDVPSPVNNDTINLGVGIISGSVQLQWTSTNQSGDAVKADVYFGTDSRPPLFASNQTSLSLTVNVHAGETYNWYVVMTDVNGVTTTGPTWTFTVYHPLTIFTGLFDCAEPVDVPHYDVNFVRKNDSTITIDNYWDSGWAADFILNLAKNTYHMAYTVWGTYAGIESGTINQTTGTMTGTYSIYHPVTPAPGTDIEDGPHTYTRK